MSTYRLDEEEIPLENLQRLTQVIGMKQGLRREDIQDCQQEVALAAWLTGITTKGIGALANALSCKRRREQQMFRQMSPYHENNLPDTTTPDEEAQVNEGFERLASIAWAEADKMKRRPNRWDALAIYLDSENEEAALRGIAFTFDTRNPRRILRFGLNAMLDSERMQKCFRDLGDKSPDFMTNKVDGLHANQRTR
jgi:hypothetical protein